MPSTCCWGGGKMERTKGTNCSTGHDFMRRFWSTMNSGPQKNLWTNKTHARAGPLLLTNRVPKKKKTQDSQDSANIMGSSIKRVY